MSGSILNISSKIDLFMYQRYLVISALHGEGEVGCGGTIAALTARGKTVHHIICTDGRFSCVDIEPEVLMQIKRQESIASSAILKCEQSVFPFENGAQVGVDEFCAAIVRFIATFRPEVVIAPDFVNDSYINCDRARVAEAARQAVFTCSFPKLMQKNGLKPLAFPPILALYYTSRPDTFVDVSGFNDKKFEAISAFASNFPLDPGDDYSEEYQQLHRAVLTKTAANGALCGCQYAEGFRTVLKNSYLNCGVNPIE